MVSTSQLQDIPSESARVPNRTRTDMRVSVGFAASFFVAFLITILAPEGITGNESIYDGKTCLVLEVEN